MQAGEPPIGHVVDWKEVVDLQRLTRQYSNWSTNRLIGQPVESFIRLPNRVILKLLEGVWCNIYYTEDRN